MKKLGLADLVDDDLRGRRVLVRVDFNVPLDGEQRITDDTRIAATLPTLERLVGAGARVIVMSHLGRPKGKPVPEMSLRPAATRLAELVEGKVDFVPATVGDEAERAAAALDDGEILVLENTRFLPGEEKNDPELARAMARLGEVYVNDAFGSAHRAHASTAGVAEVVRERGGIAAAGLLMQRELDFLGAALERPVRPFVAILGGAKISGKIDVIEALLPKVDHLLVGGAMANTFFRAMDLPTGSSLVEEDRVPMARDLLDRAGDRLVLPSDVIVADRLGDDAQDVHPVSRDAIPDGRTALDIGPATLERYRDVVRGAHTVLWNGPMGVAEIPAFRAGTEGIARALVEATQAGAVTIVGGGDSAAAIADLGLADQVSHLSTGGGASLEYLEGKELPGVAALSDATGG